MKKMIMHRFQSAPMDSGQTGSHEKQWRCQGPAADSLCQPLCRTQTTKEMAKWPQRLIYNVSAGARVYPPPPSPSSRHTEDLSQLRGDVCQAAWLTKQVRLQHTVDTGRHLLHHFKIKGKNGSIATLCLINQTFHNIHQGIFFVVKDSFSRLCDTVFNNIHSKSTQQALKTTVLHYTAHKPAHRKE